MSAFATWLAHRLWLLGGARATRDFRAALRDPRRAQEALLRRILERNAECEYGRRHHFARLRSIEEYRRAVPPVTYDAIAPEIERMKRGERQVLVSEPLLMFEKTSGSSGGAKYIPYTRSLKREFMRAVEPWMSDLHAARPELLRGGAYWSVSPLAAERERTEGGIPIGFTDDTEYFSPLARRLLAEIIVTPPELPRVPDIESARYVTLRFLLASDRLAFISVWNPSFLTLLLDALDAHAERLIEDVERGTLRPPLALPPALQAELAARLRPIPRRARRLRELLRRAGRLDPQAAWPLLSVVSCWADAAAARSLPELRALLPKVEFQPKGLLATEGVLSIPLWGHRGSALAVTSHLLELVDDGGVAHAVDEVEVGGEYRMLVSTGGGLYRYELGDRVRVVGHVEATPLIEFIGRGNLVSDLRGEKLEEAFVHRALDRVFAARTIAPRFAMLVPEWDAPPRYVLLLEPRDDASDPRTEARSESLRSIADALESELLANPHYAYCRRLGQLASVEVCRVEDANAKYIRRCIALGQRAGEVKPTALHRTDGWLAGYEAAGGQALVRFPAEPRFLRSVADSLDPSVGSSGCG